MKIIWNERRSNVLIFLEFIVVFGIFWFCGDYLYYVASRYVEPQGYDIEHTYLIEMQKNDEIDDDKEERYNHAMTLKERLKKYPGIEYVSFSSAAIPYGGMLMTQDYVINNDSVNYDAITKSVDPEYFDVFKLGVVQGRVLTELDMANKNRVALVSSDRYGYFRGRNDSRFPVEEIKTLGNKRDSEWQYTVIGITNKQKRRTFDAFEPSVFMPIGRSDYDCSNMEITIRVHPDADDDFAEHFVRDMKEQLFIGPYYLENITSLGENRNRMFQGEVGNNLRSVLAITAFLFINIFLGIIGTFWSRTESRKSEIGLRLALGSTKRKIQWQMFSETMILLTIASIIGAYICINLGQSDLLEAVGIPLADYEQAGFGTGHYFLNYGITFLFLALVSGFAVWYPSRLASRIQPADTLRAE